MASSDSDGWDDPFGMIFDCLEDVDQAKRRLPQIVGLFDDDDRSRRLCAAWACCLLATEIDDEETIEYLVRRLSDRLDDEDVSLELTTTLDYISTHDATHIETILDSLDGEKRRRGEIPLPDVGKVTRAQYFGRGHSGDGVDRIEIADRGGEDPRWTDPDGEPDHGEQTERTDTDTSAADTADNGEQRTQQRAEVASIATRSQFDKLHILAAKRQTRYADIYEALVSSHGEETAVALRLLHEPESPSKQPDFRGRVREQLTDWERTADGTHIVSLLDWGVRPQPWLATEFTGHTLVDIDRPTGEQALANAIAIATGVAELHRSGVIHGGLDPGNIVYRDDHVRETSKSRPFLDNVGLMEAFRYHFEPARLLDPRFAAPEYFDRQYGRFGPKTDIYHLGTILYYLFTGHAPFTGEFEEIREGVLTAEPQPPSSHTDAVPPALDDIVSKAMAKQKLTRYETVEHLERDLSSLSGGDSG